MASRYAAYDSPSSSNAKNPNARAVVKAKPVDVAAAGSRNAHNIGAMLKGLIKPKPRSANRLGLPVPRDVIAEDARKNATMKRSNSSALHKKLFQKCGDGGKEKSTPKALTEVKSNTRTLAMVLRSERELLKQNQEYETELLELKVALEDKNREVDKLKDLCLKQREEIKALKDAILFPEEMNAQLQLLLEKQSSELKQAKEAIPNLQKQVSSLTGQLMCLADDLAEVKAEKHTSRSYSDGPFSSPKTSVHEKEGSLDFNSVQPITSGNLDDMLLKDLNPCLTPCFSKNRSKETDEILSDDSFSDDDSSWKKSRPCSHVYGSSQGKKAFNSSERCIRPALGETLHGTRKSEGMKLGCGKGMFEF